MHGKGIFYFVGGGEYEGEWFEDYFHGEGALTFTDGRKYEGSF